MRHVERGRARERDGHHKRSVELERQLQRAERERRTGAAEPVSRGRHGLVFGRGAASAVGRGGRRRRRPRQRERSRRRRYRPRERSRGDGRRGTRIRRRGRTAGDAGRAQLHANGAGAGAAREQPVQPVREPDAHAGRLPAGARAANGSPGRRALRTRSRPQRPRRLEALALVALERPAVAVSAAASAREAGAARAPEPKPEPAERLAERPSRWAQVLRLGLGLERQARLVHDGRPAQRQVRAPLPVAARTRSRSRRRRLPARPAQPAAAAECADDRAAALVLSGPARRATAAALPAGLAAAVGGLPRRPAALQSAEGVHLVDSLRVPA